MRREEEVVFVMMSVSGSKTLALVVWLRELSSMAEALFSRLQSGVSDHKARASSSRAASSFSLTKFVV